MKRECDICNKMQKDMIIINVKASRWVVCNNCANEIKDTIRSIQENKLYQ
jgi:ribosome-binding protein aMBF1 (putative translation factor)